MKVWIELFYDEFGNLSGVVPYQDNKDAILRTLKLLSVEIQRNTDDEIIYKLSDGSMGKITRKEVL